MDKDRKIELIINLVPVVVAAIKQLPGALDLLDRMSDALKNDLTEDEIRAMLVERDAVLADLISSTEPN